MKGTLRKKRKRIKRKARGGRPSKTEQQRILRKGGSLLAKEFRLEPLRQPVDPAFSPYYEQVLSGNARAILQYCEEKRRRGRLCPSFYELLGRLATLRFWRVSDLILSNIERLGVLSWPSQREGYAYWYKELTPRCESARQFIRAAYRSNNEMNREALWRSYVLRPLATMRYGRFEGEPNEEELQQEMNAEHQKLQRGGMGQLLAWSDSHTRETVRLRLEKLGFKGHKLKLQTEIRFCMDCVQEFASASMVPKEVFFDLALTRISGGRRRPVHRPAEIARKYACRIAGISESTASHKSVQ